MRPSNIHNWWEKLPLDHEKYKLYEEKTGAYLAEKKGIKGEILSYATHVSALIIQPRTTAYPCPKTTPCSLTTSPTLEGRVNVRMCTCA